MSKTKSHDRVCIRPGVSVLSVLRHLNYKPWFALAEFVDNSIQSFLDHKDEIHKVEGENFKLIIDIDIDSTDGGQITIRDNAAGIQKKDFSRAFRPAEIPPDRSGLCEFGMGMKSAACWFSPKWSVRTSPLGEATEKRVAFDVEKIVLDKIEELDVKSRKAKEKNHYTEIVLSSIYRVPAGKTITKIKEHLCDIYRLYARENNIELRLNGDPLKYREPTILDAPYYKNLGSESILWRKDLEFDFGDDLNVHGFVAIRKKASTSRAGFSLFRRKRLVQGSGDEGYRPELIFGKPNSFIYQRLFGELHLEGFEISHTKDGFKWDENEDPFLEILKEELSDKSFPILKQAREHRVQQNRTALHKGAKVATRRTSEAIREHVPQVLLPLTKKPLKQDPPGKLVEVKAACKKVIDVELNNQNWRIVLELSDDPSIGDWLEISDKFVDEKHKSKDDAYRTVGLRLSLVHPFMERFAGSDPDQIEPLLRVAAALGLAEVAARSSGVRMAGTIRRNINELLREALWKT